MYGNGGTAGPLGGEATIRDLDSPCSPTQVKRQQGGNKAVNGDHEATGRSRSPFCFQQGAVSGPGKLVRRILRAEYVDMAELLKDNIEAERRRLAAEGGTSVVRH